MKSINTALIKLKGVTAVEIHREESNVCISGVAIERNDIALKLTSIGYPEKGNNTLISKAKSRLSCATGEGCQNKVNCMEVI